MHQTRSPGSRCFIETHCIFTYSDVLLRGLLRAITVRSVAAVVFVIIIIIIIITIRCNCYIVDNITIILKARSPTIFSVVRGTASLLVDNDGSRLRESLSAAQCNSVDAVLLRQQKRRTARLELAQGRYKRSVLDL